MCGVSTLKPTEENVGSGEIKGKRAGERGS